MAGAGETGFLWLAACWWPCCACPGLPRVLQILTSAGRPVALVWKCPQGCVCVHYVIQLRWGRECILLPSLLCAFCQVTASVNLGLQEDCTPHCPFSKSSFLALLCSVFMGNVRLVS
jgi:hypothetical protein